MVLDDITSVLKSMMPTAKDRGVPLFLMGHSMGGAEILTYAARGPTEVRSQIRGYLAESPYLALHPSSQPSRFTVTAGKLAAYILPKRQLVQRLESKWLSRDPEVNREWAEDDLCHDTGTLEGLAGMLQRGDELDKDLIVVREGEGQGYATRVFVGHGSADRVTSFETSKRWLERLKVQDKEFRSYQGWYHKRTSINRDVVSCEWRRLTVVVHAEPGDDKITFANDVADWILARAGSVKISGASESKSKL